MYKIILLDNKVMFRKSLKTCIENHGIGQITDEYSNSFEFLNKLHLLTSDLVIIGTEMTEINCKRIIQIALRIQPNIKVLCLTPFVELNEYIELTLAGATGFMLKTSTLDEIEKAIHAVVKGESYFSEGLFKLKECI